MTGTPASPKRQHRWINRVGLIGVLAPVAIWLIAMGSTLTLVRLGCAIDEGSPHPCGFLGRDISSLAYNLGFIAAWGPLFLWPISAGFALLWGITRLILFALPKAPEQPATDTSAKDT